MSDNLDNIYEDLPTTCNPLCEGCSILKLKKPDHGIIDYVDGVEQVDVLFLADGFVQRQGRYYPMRADAERVVSKLMNSLDKKVTYAISPSIKCPAVKDTDMTAQDKNLCRQHLERTVEAYNPKIIYCMGNTAMVMLIKRSGIIKKRGQVFEFSTENGSWPAMPIYHPFLVIKEPKNSYLFEQDIINGVDRYVHGIQEDVDFDFIYLDTDEKVEEMFYELESTTEDLACDIETEGFDFRNHKILTLAISIEGKNWVLPCYHKDSPFTQIHMDQILTNYIGPIMSNPNNRKVFQNAPFDLKFLIRHRIMPVNVWDTKLMAHLKDENMPKGLIDLVKHYYPREVEIF